MSVTTGFSFTNTTASTHDVTPTVIAPLSVYALTDNNSDNCELKNKTCALSQGELLSYQCAPIKKVSTKQDVTNPGPSANGVQYIVRLDEILRSINSDGTIVEDDPIVMYLTVRHPSSAFITPTHISTIFERLCGALRRSDGSYRFDDLMLSALQPVAD